MTNRCQYHYEHFLAATRQHFFGGDAALAPVAGETRQDNDDDHDFGQKVTPGG